MFENFGKKVADFGNSIKSGAQTFSETSSLNSKIDEYNRQINNCFHQLGQAYYERNKDNVPAEYQGVFDQIRVLNENIIRCQEQVRTIKGIRVCPRCGADVQANVMFCGQCGFSMPAVQPQQPAMSGAVCGTCGAPLEADSMFCTNCGARTQQQPAQPAQPVYETPVPPAYEAPVPPAYEAPVPPAFEASEAANAEPESPKAAVCHNCGAPLESEAVFCANCGEKVQ